MIEKHPVKQLAEIKSEIEDKVRKDERSLLITNSLAKKLRSKYTFTKNQKLLNKIKTLATADFYAQTWELPESKKEINDVILTIEKKKEVFSLTFLSYIQTQQKSKIKTKPI